MTVVTVGGFSSIATAPPASAAVKRAGDGVLKIARDPLEPSRANALLKAGATLDRAGHQLPQAPRTDPKWPGAGSGSVDVPSGGAAVRAGDSPVWVAPISTGKAAAAVGKVDVTAYDPATATRLGGLGTAFTVARADGGTASGPVRVQVPVTGFTEAYGADLTRRVRLLQLPACALKTPIAADCRRGTVLPGSVDVGTGRLTADVTASAPAGDVFVLAATGTPGVTGSYTATSLSSSSKWQVGTQAGGFSWNYPIVQMPAPAGNGPSLSLGYASQSVDGLAASTNSQPAWTGLGWDLGVPFIERSYASCSKASALKTGDLCWAGEALTLSLNGTGSPLVHDDAASTGNTDVWRPREDPGWRVERKHLSAGQSNGDNDGEYWTVLTPDGTTYTFGRGAQATTGRDTGSAFTVPVFGPKTGDACHADDWCQQAWRWNLDSVVDAHGNASSWFYTQEKNNYARKGTTTTPYVRGGYLSTIEYGLRAGTEGTTAPARLQFAVLPRCSQVAGGGGTSCPPLTSTSNDYPDTPVDQLCSANCTAAQGSPTFFTGVLLRSVAAQRSTGANAWTTVDTTSFDYTFPAPSDGTDASLFLSRIHRTGQGGSGSLALPDVVLTGTEFDNRVDYSGQSVPALRKLRVTGVVDELGRQVQVTYGQANPCTRANLPTGRADTNTQDCYPSWTVNVPAGADDPAGPPGFGWFHKWLATSVTVRDAAGGSPPQTTQYRYQGGAAFRHDDTPTAVIPDEEQSWSEWRGYATVDVAQMSDPSSRGEADARALSLTRHLYYRGLDGDRLAGGGSKSVTVTDSTGAATRDTAWLGGAERELRQFDADGTGTATAAAGELKGVVHTYAAARTTPAGTGGPDARADAHIVVESGTSSRETVVPEAGGTRTTRTTVAANTFDVYGQPLTGTTTAAGAGAAGGGSDTRCVRYSYARDAATVAAGLVSLAYRVRNYAGTCASPTALIAGKDGYFDGATTLGAPITKGDLTRAVTALTASAPDTVATSLTTAGTFDAYGRPLTVADGNGKVTRTAYAPATGLPSTVTTTNALGQASVSTLDPDHRQEASVRDANNRIATLTYDPLGRLLTARTPDQVPSAPPAMVFAYRLDTAHTAAPRVTTRTLQSGSTYVTSTKFLDSLGRDRQTQTVSPASTAGSPQTVVVDTRYDDRGLVAATTLPSVAPGAAGAELLAVSPNATTETRNRYDSLARVVSSDFTTSGTLRWSTRTAYYGDHERVTPPSGGVVKTTWTDVRGRQVRTDQGTGSGLVTTRNRFDDSDRQVSTTDPGGHVSSTGYDLAGRRVSSVDADAGKATSTFDGAGNQVTATDASGSTVTTDYDALNRPVAVWKGASGSGTRLGVSVYDSADVVNGIGRLASQTVYAPADGGKQYTQAVSGYDARGRVTGRSYTFPAGTGLSLIPLTFKVGYTYDTAGHRTSISYPDRLINLDPEIVTTGYDGLGQIDSVTGTQTPLIGDPKTVPYVSDTGYAADGKLTSRDYANPLYPITRRYGYEAGTQRLSNISTLFGDPIQPGTTAKQDDTYSWDPSGNLRSVVDRAPQNPLATDPIATCYTYDGLDRLAHAWTTKKTDCADGSDTLVHDGPSGFNESWTYSGDGNMTGARSLLINRDFVYEDANHPHAVTRAGTDVFGYDAQGQQNSRLKGLESGLISYTPQHQTATVLAGKLLTRYVYAGDGTRLVRFNPDTTATLYLDGEEITVVAGISKGTRYYRAGDTVIAQRLVTTKLVWQLNDNQGSAQIAVIAGTGIPIRTYYDPYGKIRDFSAPTSTDHGFLGKPADPTTGLNALGERMYDPDLGRFISPDAMSVQATAQTANAYAYAASNPVLYSDPTGLCPRDFCTELDKSEAGRARNARLAASAVMEASAEPAFGGVSLGSFVGKPPWLWFMDNHENAVRSTLFAILFSPTYDAVGGGQITVSRTDNIIPGGGNPKFMGKTPGYPDIILRAGNGKTYVWEVKAEGFEESGKKVATDQIARYTKAFGSAGGGLQPGWDVSVTTGTNAQGQVVTARSVGGGVRLYSVSGPPPEPQPQPDPVRAPNPVWDGVRATSDVALKGLAVVGVVGGLILSFPGQVATA